MLGFGANSTCLKLRGRATKINSVHLGAYGDAGEGKKTVIPDGGAERRRQLHQALRRGLQLPPHSSTLAGTIIRLTFNHGTIKQPFQYCNAV